MALRRAKPEVTHTPRDQRIELFSYHDIAQQTGFPWHLLRKVAQRMGVEQTVYMRDSYGRQTPATKKVGVRRRNLGRIIKGAAIEMGKSSGNEFERDMTATLDSKLYRGFRQKREQTPQDLDEARQLDELERRLGLK